MRSRSKSIRQRIALCQYDVNNHGDNIGIVVSECICVRTHVQVHAHKPIANWQAILIVIDFHFHSIYIISELEAFGLTVHRLSTGTTIRLAALFAAVDAALLIINIHSNINSDPAYEE